MPRLFVAVDLPQEVKDLVTALKAPLSGARWCPIEQFHLTLRFIGDADARTFDAIKKALAAVRVEPFPLALSGVGHFPPGKQPRVLWVGLTASATLLDLQQQVEKALQKADIPPEGKRFSPHITLARLHDTPRDAVQLFEQRHHDLASDPFTVDTFHLYSSVLKNRGATHCKEATYRF